MLDLRSLVWMKHVTDGSSAICNANTCPSCQLKSGCIHSGYHGSKLWQSDLLPKNPLIVLTPIKVPTFGLKAVGICNNANNVKDTRYNFRRPNVSESGANTRGPRPRKTTKPVVAPTTTLSVVLRSLAISAMPGVNIEDANGERTRLG